MKWPMFNHNLIGCTVCYFVLKEAANWSMRAPSKFNTIDDDDSTIFSA